MKGAHTSSSFAKKTHLNNLKSDVHESDIDKFKTLPTSWRNLESKVDKLDVDNLVTVPVDLSKLSDVVKMILLKKIHIMLRWKVLTIKYLKLLT